MDGQGRPWICSHNTCVHHRFGWLRAEDLWQHLKHQHSETVKASKAARFTASENGLEPIRQHQVTAEDDDEDATSIATPRVQFMNNESDGEVDEDDEYTSQFGTAYSAGGTIFLATTGRRTQKGATWEGTRTLNNATGFAGGAPVSANYKSVREGRGEGIPRHGVWRTGKAPARVPAAMVDAMRGSTATSNPEPHAGIQPADDTAQLNVMYRSNGVDYILGWSENLKASKEYRSRGEPAVETLRRFLRSPNNTYITPFYSVEKKGFFVRWEKEDFHYPKKDAYHRFGVRQRYGTKPGVILGEADQDNVVPTATGADR